MKRTHCVFLMFVAAVLLGVFVHDQGTVTLASSVSGGSSGAWAAASTPAYNIGGTTTCNLATSNLCWVTAGAGDTTLAIINPANNGTLYWLRFTQDGVGGRTLAYPTAAKGFPVTAIAGANQTIEVPFTYDGTNYNAGASGFPFSLWHGIYAVSAAAGPCGSGAGSIYLESNTWKSCANGGAPILLGAPGPTGATGATGATGTIDAQYKIRPCEIVIGDPGAASSALANDNDSPSVCGNLTGATMTILEVKCYANTSTGSPTVLPIITGGASDSILASSTPLACGNGAFGSAGGLNGTPTQVDGATIDANISTAGGTAKYMIIRINRTL